MNKDIEPQGTPEPGDRTPKRTVLSRIGEYKEAIGVVIAVAGAIFSGVAWVISYFATQATVSELECRLTHQMNAANFDSKSEIIRSQIEARQSQIQSTALQKQTQSTQAAVTKLSSDVKELEKAAKEETRKSTEQLSLAAKCATAK